MLHGMEETQNTPNVAQPITLAVKESCEHEFDWDEGYTCINCGEEGDVGEAIDNAEYSQGDR